MMRSAIIITIGLMSVLQIQAQSWSKTFGTTYTSLGNAAVATRDGGFAIVGYAEGIGGGKGQVQLLKIDVSGKEQWIRGFGGQDVDLGLDIKTTIDNGFVLAGSSVVDNADAKQFFLVKTNEKGDEIWSKTYGGTSNDIAFSVQPTLSGDYLLAGSSQNTANNNTDAVLFLLDANGNELWNITFGGAGTQEFKKVIEVADGYICAGSSVVGKNSKGQDNRDALIVKISKTGQIVWSKTYGTDTYEDAQGLVELSSGGFVICGKDTSDIIVSRTNSDGTLVWTKKFGENNEDEGFAIIQTKDKNIVIAGSSATNNSNVDGYALKISLDGNQIWTRRVGSSQRYETFNHVIQNTDGSLFFTGVWGSNVFLITSKTYAVKTEAEGVLGNNYINGHVFYDRNNNCKFDNGDTPLNDWLIQISKPARSYIGISNGLGEIFSTVDSGLYNVRLLPQNSYWKQACQTSYNISLKEQEDTVTVDFALRPQVNCPAMEVNITTPQLIRCKTNTYTVNFCNRGTVAANGAYVDVTFDEYFDNISANLPLWSLSNNKLRCQLGNVPAGACGQFQIFVTLDKNCNSTVLGQTHQVVAHIYPDQICTNPDSNWDGSSIEVTGACKNNQVQFIIKNTGAKNQSQPRNSIIIEDDIIYLQKPIGPLDAAEDTTILMPPSGKTYRILIEQSAGHPGKSNPTVAVEGCSNGVFSTGFVSQFSEDDGDPFVSISTQESTGKNNQNEKIAFPRGYRASHFITDSTDLEYQIYFNNTYGDTLKNLTILDTLSNFLNPYTIREIQCSHAYALSFAQSNVLQFDFRNISLPDSSVNALTSSGFVKFKISQKVKNPNSTIIRNRAGIYYGNQGARLTNTVIHTVGTNFISVATTNPELQGVKISASPNPFTDLARIEISGIPQGVEKEFSLYDLSGNLLRSEKFTSEQLQIQKAELASGMYIFHLKTKGLWIGSGK
ncbi:MAG: T9SS type A sorting domain-containing protein, partial [Saprospiraceae bacterium]